MNLQISPTELAEQLRSGSAPHLLDVRQLEENQFVALPNSTLIPLGELASRIDEIEGWKEEEIVVYCHHGIRSLNAIGQLKHFGFTKLRNLAGGIDRWSTEVDPKSPRY
ncbi:MAG: moeZ 1 [Verrucomicrobiales bacterium]|nr:moeZ 1 [Verrucomicrobiales bacterium]